MNVNGIGNLSFYEKMRNTKESDGSQNKMQGRFSDTMENTASQTSHQVNTTVRGQRGDLVKAQTPIEQSQDVTEHNVRCRNDAMGIGAVSSCEVRDLSNGDSDSVKVNVLGGYTLKARVDVDEHRVYIEQKKEDGTVAAYEVDPLKVSGDTKDPIEQMALETWKGYQVIQLSGKTQRAEGTRTDSTRTDNTKIDNTRTDNTKINNTRTDNTNINNNEMDTDDSKTDTGIERSWEEAMLDFYNYVEDRIKNGDPKIPIGGSEMSVKEWDKLLEKVDGNLENIREELEERIRKQREERGESVSDTDVARAEDTSETANKYPFMTAYYDDVPMETWALTDQRYTDEATGISWYAGEGRGPYMIGEDAERLKQLCKESGENPAEKFAQITDSFSQDDWNQLL